MENKKYLITSYSDLDLLKKKIKERGEFVFESSEINSSTRHFPFVVAKHRKTAKWMVVSHKGSFANSDINDL